MRVFGLARNALAYSRRHGLAKTWDHTLHRISEPFWERWYGIETSEYMDSVSDPDCLRYEPSEYRALRKVFTFVRPDPRRDVLLDYGSGKGRAIVVGGTFGFSRIIGVEISPDLNRVARENLARAKRRMRCRNIELVTMDAAAYRVPNDVTTIFLYNPFKGEYLSRVLDNIRQSLSDSPRRLVVAYKNPQADLQADGWFRETWRTVCHCGNTLLLYESVVGRAGA